MTQVVFKFQKPDGSPYVAAEFTVALKRTGLNDPGDSVVLPATYAATTDDTGSFVLDLAPSSSPYTIRSVEDVDLDNGSCHKYAVSYRFYVPNSSTPVQAQDLFLAPPPGSVAWDEAALAQLAQSVADAEEASASATEAATAAAASVARAEEIADSLGDIDELAAQVEDHETRLDALDILTISQGQSITSLANVNAQQTEDLEALTTRVDAAEDDISLLEVQREFKLTAGTNIVIDRTDPLNPVIRATGSASGGADWGDISGNITDQTDLQEALDDKVDAVPGMGLSELSFTQADKDKLDNATGNTHNKGYYPSEAALRAAYPTAVAGDFAFADLGVGTAPKQYVWDTSDDDWAATTGEGGSMSPADVKASYESNANTNAYTDIEKAKLGGIQDGAQVNATPATQIEADAGTEVNLRSWSPLRIMQTIQTWWSNSADKTKLNGIAAGATANSSDSTLLDRANHTGTQLGNTISNFAASVRSSVLAGLTPGANEAILATDTALAAWAKLQAQITAHVGSGGNAHSGATTSVAGFMSSADKTKLDTLPTAPASNGKFYLLKDRGWVEWVSSNPMTTLGDMVYGAASGVPARLAKGTDGQVLAMVSGLPAWADSANGSSAFLTPLPTPAATANGQTVFSLAHTPGAGFLVFNGSLLRPDAYTEDATGFVLGDGSNVRIGTQLYWIGFGTFNVANALPIGGVAADSSKLNGQAAAYYATAAALTAAIATQLGVGQTVQNLTSSRALATSYTNNTGRPIEVSVTCIMGAGNQSFTLTVGGVQVGIFVAYGASVSGTLTWVVPNDVSYSAAGGTLTVWAELR